MIDVSVQGGWLWMCSALYGQINAPTEDTHVNGGSTWHPKSVDTKLCRNNIGPLLDCITVHNVYQHRYWRVCQEKHADAKQTSAKRIQPTSLIDNHINKSTLILKWFLNKAWWRQLIVCTSSRCAVPGWSCYPHFLPVLLLAPPGIMWSTHTVRCRGGPLS